MKIPFRDFMQGVVAQPAPAPSDTAMIAAVLRLAEAIKRTAALCGAEPLRPLAQAADVLLARLQEGSPPTPGAVALIGTALDRLARMLDDLEVGAAPQVLPEPLPPLPADIDGAQPFGRAFADLPRLVDDLGRASGKEIALVIDDGNVRLDRRLIDRLRDPLAQLVRYCVAAGLETPDVRIASNKAREGTVRVAAAQGPDGLLLEVGDDGRGLDLPQIGADALGSGLVTETALAAMTPDNLAQLVFASSVGDEPAADRPDLDAVRSAIAAAGGTVSVRSRAGAGALFTVHLRLALDVARVFIVGAGGRRFALPQGPVVEVLALGGASLHRIERIGNFLLLACRGNLFPAVDLTAALRRPDAGVSGADLPDADLSDADFTDADLPEDERMAAIMRVDGVVFGLLLDTVEDLHEAVVTPRAPPAGARSVCAGETTLEDGSVAPVVDPAALAAFLYQRGSESARPEVFARPVARSRRGNVAQVGSMERA